MAPDRTVGKRGEERSLLTAEAKGENPMKLTRLEFAQHPRPPQRELRQMGVFDSGGNLIGHVENAYVDDERTFRFVSIAMSGLVVLGRKYRLVPVEAISEAGPDSITLTVDKQTIENAPTFSDPRAAPDEGLQRATCEQYGLATVPPPEP
jgi:hypothetical protein